MNISPGVALVCVALLALMRVNLKLFGFRRTLRLTYALAEWRSPPKPNDSLTTARRISRVIELVAPLVPGRILCLEQSLALLVMLRWSGVPANLRIGALVRPFVAHAWVESDGQPLNAEPEFLALFQPFPTLPQ
jgi:transglutaminase superfamily protein